MWTSDDNRFGRESKVNLIHLDSFSIPSFYIRKNRPRGHRYGKAPGCKEYHTANQLAKKCRKREYESIHDRYIRDKAFRRAVIDHGRTEQMIIEMDKLAKEDHSYKASKEEIEFYRGQLVDPLKCGAR